MRKIMAWLEKEFRKIRLMSDTKYWIEYGQYEGVATSLDESLEEYKQILCEFPDVTEEIAEILAKGDEDSEQYRSLLASLTDKVGE